VEQTGTFAQSGIVLDALQLFRGAARESVMPLLSDCPVVRVAEGEIVADTRSKGGRLYIVLRGALSVMHADAVTAGERATGKVLPGECIGELSVLDESGTSDSMCALQESELLVIEAERLWQLIDESNGVARNLLRLLSFRVRAANAQLRRRHKVGEFYRQLSMVDSLTGLYNRAWLDENLPAMASAAQAASEPLSVIMIDIDRFKQFNDEYGHQCGDAALRAAARTIAGALRPTDCAARYGGEELIVLLPATGQDAAVMVAQRLCEQVREAVVFADMRKSLPHITASFGVAALETGQDAQALVARADAALYRAKEAGRDRVAG
jgi:diguanylate cyclase (GGDEF)-like protein